MINKIKKINKVLKVKCQNPACENTKDCGGDCSEDDMSGQWHIISDRCKLCGNHLRQRSGGAGYSCSYVNCKNNKIMTSLKESLCQSEK